MQLPMSSSVCEPSQLLFSDQPGPCCSQALPQLWWRLGKLHSPFLVQKTDWGLVSSRNAQWEQKLFTLPALLLAYQFGVQVELYCEWENSLSDRKQLLLSARGFCHPWSCGCGFGSGRNSPCCTCIKFGSSSSSFLSCIVEDWYGIFS